MQKPYCSIRRRRPRNFELLAGFMKSAADFADEAGRKLLKVFKAVVITGDETGECRQGRHD